MVDHIFKIDRSYIKLKCVKLNYAIQIIMLNYHFPTRLLIDT